MGVLCSLGRHEAVPDAVWNDGYYFSKCRQCECALIRRRRGWRQVPRGYHVVWKPRTEEDVDWPALMRTTRSGLDGFH